MLYSGVCDWGTLQSNNAKCIHCILAFCYTHRQHKSYMWCVRLWCKLHHLLEIKLLPKPHSAELCVLCHLRGGLPQPVAVAAHPLGGVLPPVAPRQHRVVLLADGAHPGLHVLEVVQPRGGRPAPVAFPCPGPAPGPSSGPQAPPAPLAAASPSHGRLLVVASLLDGQMVEARFLWAPPLRPARKAAPGHVGGVGGVMRNENRLVV